MTLIKLILVLSAGCSLLAQSGYTEYDLWRAQPSIRVGLSHSGDTFEFYSNETLLVLDGEKVVETISPGGKFYVLARPSVGEPARFLQLRASRSKQVVEEDREHLAAKYPEYSFVVSELRDEIWALRLGPLDTLAAGEIARKFFSKNGYSDCFLNTDRREYELQWVDRNFDKYPFKSNDPAIVRYDPEQVITFNGTDYRGILRFRYEDDKLSVINQLPLESYLRGVVPSELGPMSYPELEAQKAQAVAARTYAAKNMGRFARKGYDICDGPACQAYEGTRNEHELSDRAIKETEGQVLAMDGKLIDALYTSTDGGTTENVENVFPGRSDAYLRAKSGYVTTFSRYELPARVPDRARFADVPEDLAAKTVLWGFPTVPDLQGNFSGKELRAALGHFAWVLGPQVPKLGDGSLSYRSFWTALAELDVFKAAAQRQVPEADLEIMLRHNQVPAPLRGFAGLAVRYELTFADRLATFGLKTNVPREFAYQVLVDLCAILGPEPNWQRYRLESYADNKLELSRGKQRLTLNLADFDYYVTFLGTRMEFVDRPRVQEWDRIYLLDAPFSARVLRLRESGSVGSADRFSAFDTWIEKKTVTELEDRARRYVRELQGLRDVQVLKRSETGRVTEMAFIADSGTHIVTGLNIRWSLGVRENLFDLIPGYRDGKLVHLTVLGKGWGHGVGMSQVGAFSLARMGWDYEKILTYYYTGVELKQLAEVSAF